MPSLPPPQGFEYQAFGFLAGTLTTAQEPYSLLVNDQPLTITGCSDRLQRWLYTQELPLTGYWGLYPKSTRSGTTFWLKSFEPATPSTELGVFSIDGQLVATKGSTQLIRLHRNQANSTEKPFSVKVSGFLPEPKPGQFWQLECLWEDDKFTLLDGYRYRSMI
ncbi:MAG: hypothetical protein KME45_32315 [Stenomitos rutilans HA7619-LM2]|jgi:hypothetical protein|nr:hypothetical protein [Stenomitos rutilans HA7619-LM2]